MENLPKVIVILGPTSSGKTSLSIELAKKYHGEVISADSRKIYKYMNIGSAKPSITKQQNIAHFGFDLTTPDHHYSVKDFQKYAFSKIDEITKRGNLPILVGGTGLYIAAVIDNYEFEDYEPDWVLREQLQEKDLDDLVDALKKYDEKALAPDDWTNKRRVIRALEYCKTTGKRFSDSKKKGEEKYDVLQLGMTHDVETLDQRIKDRIEEMLKEGLLDEIAFLAAKYGFDAPGMQAISYQEFRDYHQGKEDLEAVKGKIFYSNRQYARRQMKWFKRDERIKWVHDFREAEKYVKEFLKG